METNVKMEKLEKDMKQYLHKIAHNFKHLLKDAIATIMPQANISKVDVSKGFA